MKNITKTYEWLNKEKMHELRNKLTKKIKKIKWKNKKIKGMKLLQNRYGLYKSAAVEHIVYTLNKPRDCTRNILNWRNDERTNKKMKKANEVKKKKNEGINQKNIL